MLDSNVPDIALEPDKTIQKVRDRFCLNLTEEQAVQNLQQLMDESISALFPQMVEQIHRWAQVSSSTEHMTIMLKDRSKNNSI